MPRTPARVRRRTRVPAPGPPAAGTSSADTAAEEEAHDQPGRAGRALWRRLPLRTAAGLVPAVLVGVWALAHRSLMASGVHDLVAADPGWLLAALACTGLGWAANSVARQGTVLEPLPRLPLLATQFAATAAGQLAPAGLGASAVNLRFLRVNGVPLARATAALALYSLAESCCRVGLLLVLLAANPHALHAKGLLPDGDGLLLLAAAAAAVTAAAVLTLVLAGSLRRAAAGFVTDALADARTLHARPERALALWGGSLVFPLIQAASMAAVARALDLPVAPVPVALAYLAATCAAALVPTPGGIGSVDAALAVALVAAGAPTGAAASAVLAFRIVTVWLPLLPAALTLSALIRRKVL
ncbi:lysylphosphatidylglycerol synthase domain-containing protein [Streptomyces sp. CA2R106]|uniref:lysylphosphatidylglycerol synthase domain-containing protein n=1 Tax=Streptomyces sp. CA2R106 TaxID=3120153 RepID=UPI00300BE389